MPEASVRRDGMGNPGPLRLKSMNSRPEKHLVMPPSFQPRRRTGLILGLITLMCAATVLADAPADHPGAGVYREHCQRCHGDRGQGTADVPTPLVGDRSVNQLAKYVHDTMPEDDPEAVDRKSVV